MKTRYLIPVREELEDNIRLAREYDMAFEYNDFYQPGVMDNPALIDELIAAYRNTGRDTSEDTLHGAFYDVNINSSDKRIRDVSRERVVQSMEIARRLGLRAVIFHTNYLPTFMLESYRKAWVEDNVEFWGELLEEYKDLSIYLENMFDRDPELLGRVAGRIKNERFGVCFDYGHAALSRVPLSRWMEVLSPFIRHIHINDNDLIGDLHYPVGAGKISWEEYDSLITRCGIKPSVLLEVNGLSDQKKSIEYMVRENLYPFREQSLFNG